MRDCCHRLVYPLSFFIDGYNAGIFPLLWQLPCGPSAENELMQSVDEKE